MILCFICVVKFKAQCLVLIFIKFKDGSSLISPNSLCLNKKSVAVLRLILRFKGHRTKRI